MSGAERTIVVTGARGLLGVHLCPVLEAEGVRVIAAGRDLLDLSRPFDASRLPKRVDAVVYLAQSNRFREFPEAADDIFQVNTAQLLATMDYARCAGASNFVYASTGGLYASSDEPVAEGSDYVSPMSFYAASKRAAEVLTEAYRPYFNIALLRYFFIYGAGQKREMLVPRLVDSVAEGRAVTLQGEEGLRINPVHASDAAAATAAAAWLETSATINIAGPETLSIRQMCETIGEKIGCEPHFDVKADQKPGHLIADTGRMTSLLGGPSTHFADGVADVLQA